MPDPGRPDVPAESRRRHGQERDEAPRSVVVDVERLVDAKVVT